MNLKQMEYFLAIVNEGNISAAAKSLHISQPPLSAQMKLLEDELGVVLFERGSRSIFLTEAGKVFYEKALHILHLTTAVSDELQQMGQGLKGPLHLGMISSVQTPRLIRALSSFVSLHPEVTLRKVVWKKLEKFSGYPADHTVFSGDQRDPAHDPLIFQGDF